METGHAKETKLANGAWLDRRFGSHQARYSLYCFPFAGGSATYYMQWSKLFGDDIELVPIQLPGRGPRFEEACSTSIADSANEIVREIVQRPTRPLLFGHSMGAILAYEVARLLRTTDHSAAHLFVSARPAPAQQRPRRRVSNLPRNEFVQLLRDYGSAPEEVLTNSELLDIILPMTRADFAMIEQYRRTPGPPLACPISAWCGTDDPDVPPASMCDWASETTEGVELFVRKGDHFFVTDVRQEIVQHIYHTVTRLDGKRPQAASACTSRSNRKVQGGY